MKKYALHPLKSLISSKTEDDKLAEAYRRTIRESAKVGGSIFGPIPEGIRREFFCLDERTWVWHEEWKDEQAKTHIRTTRYDIRPHGIFKAQNGQPYRPVTYKEGHRLIGAMRRYNELVNVELEPILGYRLAV